LGLKNKKKERKNMYKKPTVKKIRANVEQCMCHGGGGGLV